MWITIEKHPRYEVSDSGEVRFKHTGRIRKPQVNSDGYLKTQIEGCNYFIHRLVALAFIPNPDDLPDVNHDDEDKTNNVVSNLRWMTRQGNVEYSVAKSYNFINPQGEPIVIFNMTKFCRDNNLSRGNMIAVIAGLAGHHKGYRLDGT